MVSEESREYLASPLFSGDLQPRRLITDRHYSGQDVKQIIAKLTPVLRGWHKYFQTGLAGMSVTGWTSSYFAGCCTGCSGAAANGRHGRSSGPRLISME